MQDRHSLRDLTIIYQQTDKLTPRPTNARTHSKKQIEQIAQAIRRFGFTNPILIDQDNGVIAGHGRLAAAKRIGLSRVPTVRLADMTEAENPRLCHCRQQACGERRLGQAAAGP
ncbi:MULTISPECIES: ParB/Srx family N-terminal domain-containing protein [unclassified Bradyrhizobium]|uniref:ParB/Srx family N-terminal domain-containing protein n=1 Tax=unclassified Bradyrhizobium TaxID=2631580 RepID=UPI0024784A1B|nr:MULTISPECIES: ParB/Srx family N-terminal domain-containing protein [unclassified Bradyrhizobium]WGR73902.1 ParB/Srx family N-terminal domain-containing protein [Bradyrhizobium sp. ISRA426]WGR78739.1 ParB/Srx family N-terminal domain-containing protein [Bradyrhizobium sp. ISRA430]WGR89141.1 ParB/Srx family N-terminal domain-containing protein [Bradyrhizobium sp. ISRA432]